MTRPASPFAPPPIKRKSTVKHDTMAEFKEKVAVRVRDTGCVAARASGKPLVCDGPLSVDHVRTSGGLGIKSETHRRNMVVLCLHHHRAKTEYGRTWRPLLLAYLERVER